MDQQKTCMRLLTRLDYHDTSHSLCTGPLYILLLLLTAKMENKEQKNKLTEFLNVKGTLSEEIIEHLKLVSDSNFIEQAKCLFYSNSSNQTEEHIKYMKENFKIITTKIKYNDKDHIEKINDEVSKISNKSIVKLFNKKTELRGNFLTIGQSIKLKPISSFKKQEPYLFTNEDSKYEVIYSKDSFRKTLYGKDEYKEWITLECSNSILAHFIKPVNMVKCIGNLKLNYNLRDTEEKIIGELLIPNLCIQTKFKMKNHFEDLGIFDVKSKVKDIDELLKMEDVFDLSEIYCYSRVYFDGSPLFESSFSEYFDGLIKPDIWRFVLDEPFIVIIEDTKGFIHNMIKVLDDKALVKKKGYCFDA